MTRPEWTNLNGLWQYSIRGKRDGRPAVYDGNILVPFPVESSLSGVKRSVSPDQRLWYRRTFSLAKPKPDTRFLLHFGAVDWDATVYVNGDKVGEHKGGFDPFTFDVTDFLNPFKRGQEIIVSVWDPTDAGSQPRGKQVLKPGGIMYTANTGIWQTVWLEPVPARHIESLKVIPDVDAGLVRITPTLSGVGSQASVTATVSDGAKQIGEATGRAGETLVIKIADARLWGPDHPFLYDLKVAIKGGRRGRLVLRHAEDRASPRTPPASTGCSSTTSRCSRPARSTRAGGPTASTPRPTDEALNYDLDVTRRFGFNMIRKHVKVEPARWYYPLRQDGPARLAGHARRRQQGRGIPQAVRP